MSKPTEMNMKESSIRLSLLMLGLVASGKMWATSGDTLCLLQINDIYEISPLQNGRVGGIARIASYIDECERRYDTKVFVAGDFLSPSVMGTATVSGERLNGRQMIDAFNAIGVDYVTFGNHEFDIGEQSLQQRINESEFTWFSGNVFRNDGSPFKRLRGDQAESFPTSVLIPSGDGRFSVRVFSLTLPSNTPAYSRFIEYDKALENYFRQKPKRRIAEVGLTHLSAAEDLDLLKKYPRIRLIMGGHEHENMYLSEGKNHVAKADANGKTIYRHLVYLNKRRRVEIRSELVKMDEGIPFKPSVESRVKYWENAVFEAFRKSGLEPERQVCRVTDTLRGTEASIRYGQNNLGRMITGALDADKKADAAFINSGSIRIDDDVTGPITELDVIRIMPFGNKIVEVTMKGSLLEKILRSNDERKGLGGYLQMDQRIQVKTDRIFMNGHALSDTQTYRIHTIEFLLSGKELKLEYLTSKHPEIISVSQVLDEKGLPLDLRLEFIRRLKRAYGGFGVN
jgi:2',3'-cyclic-nucleotide 2'-phosphodiesterase (5'-nucleotidase family)